MTDISRSAWRQMDISTPSSTFPQEAVAYDGKANVRFASGNFFTNFFRSKTFARFTQTLQDQYDTWLGRAVGHDPSKFLTNKTLAAVFEGRAAVTTVVETRLAGLPDEDADPALDSANAVSSKPLGSGQVNTVYQIGYKDGSTYIFKPEAPGRRAETKAASRCWRIQSERHNLRQECAGRCKQPSGSAVPSRPPLPHRQARLVRGVSLFAKCIFYGQHKHDKNERWRMEGTKQEEAINELKAALAELESEEGLEMFVEGHGLQSRYFAFSWQSDELEIDYNLPYARVLSDEDAQKLDASRIGAAIRLAILLLASSSSGALLHDGEASLSVTADDTGASYSIVGSDGEVVDSGDEWEPLVARLAADLPNVGDNVQIIWP